MVFGFLKKIFHRGEEEETEDIGMGGMENPQPEMNLGFQNQMGMEPGFQSQITQTQTFPQQNIQPSVQTQTIPPPSMFNPPVQHTYGREEEIIERIRLLENKIDVLNAKIEQILQRLYLLEAYIKR